MDADSVCPFEMDVRTDDTHPVVTIITMKGRLDAHAATTFTKRLNDLLYGGALRVILEGSALTFISSTGIGAIVRAHQVCARGVGGGLVVLPSPCIEAVRRPLKLGSVIQFAETLDEAVELLRSNASD